jgi:putative ABC transport system permease protein
VNFTVIVGGIMMYTTSNKAIQGMKQSVAHSITLKPIEVFDRSAGFTGYLYGIEAEDVAKFINSEYVDTYNYYDYASVNYKNIKKYVGNEEEYNKLIEKYGKSSSDSDGTLYGLVESSYDVAFTVNGYKIIEGRPITAEDSEQKICLISEEVAELNKLKLGDIIEAEQVHRHIDYSLTIVGIFSTPEGEYLTGRGYSPAEIIFMPVTTMQVYLDENGYENKIRDTHNACVYLKDPSYLDAFTQEVQNKMNIQTVFDSHFGNNIFQKPEKFADWSSSELSNYYSENHWYNLQVDREWYEMIATPIENASCITGILVAGVIAGATVILVLLSVLSLKGRKREFGILLSMGEGKIKVIGQVLVEEFLPIIIAASIGLFCGIAIGSTFMKGLSDDVYNQKAEELYGENEQVLYGYMQEGQNFDDEGWNHSGTVDLIFKLSGRITIQANVEPKINPVTIISYIVITFGLVFVILIIQMISILRLKQAHILSGKS